MTQNIMDIAVTLTMGARSANCSIGYESCAAMMETMVALARQARSTNSCNGHVSPAGHNGHSGHTDHGSIGLDSGFGLLYAMVALAMMASRVDMTITAVYSCGLPGQ